MECLEVVPQVEEYEVEYVYQVSRNGLVLVVTVWPLESVISLSLRQQVVDFPLIEFALFVRNRAHYVNDKRGEYLEFQDCVLLPGRFSYQQAGNVFDKTRFNCGLTIQLTLKPQIQVRYLQD